MTSDISLTIRSNGRKVIFKMQIAVNCKVQNADRNGKHHFDGADDDLGISDDDVGASKTQTRWPGFFRTPEKNRHHEYIASPTKIKCWERMT